MKRKVVKKLMVFVMVIIVTAVMLTGCRIKGFFAETPSSAGAKLTTEKTNIFDATTIFLFAANSMSDAMNKVIEKYREAQPNVTISAVYNSSGTLLAQIEESGGCDIFLSAAQKQMDVLQNSDHLVEDGTRHNVVNNQLIVMTYNGSKTAVEGLKTLSKASSLAIAGGTVPAGSYTRKAMISLGILEKTGDPAQITTEQMSKALGGVTINECESVGAAAQAVSEGSNEAATCYYSDYIKYTKQGFDLKVLEKVSYDLTGYIIYPVCQVKNSDAKAEEKRAAANFLNFMLSDDAKAIYKEYGFDTKVKD